MATNLAPWGLLSTVLALWGPLSRMLRPYFTLLMHACMHAAQFGTGYSERLASVPSGLDAVLMGLSMAAGAMRISPLAIPFRNATADILRGAVEEVDG